MKLLRRVTWVEWFTILCVAIFVGGTLLPDSSTQTRWRLERRARDFKKTITPKLRDKSIIATDAAIAGTWICRHDSKQANRPLIPHREVGSASFWDVM